MLAFCCVVASCVEYPIAKQPPIQIEKAEYLKGASSGVAAYLTNSSANYRLTYKNASDKEVAAVRFGIQYYDAVDSPTFQSKVTADEKVKPGKSKRVIGAAWLGNAQTRLAAYVDRVKFRDGTYWNDDGFKVARRATNDQPCHAGGPGLASRFILPRFPLPALISVPRVSCFSRPG